MRCAGSTALPAGCVLQISAPPISQPNNTVFVRNCMNRGPLPRMLSNIISVYPYVGINKQKNCADAFKLTMDVYGPSLLVYLTHRYPYGRHNMNRSVNAN